MPERRGRERTRRTSGGGWSRQNNGAYVLFGALLTIGVLLVGAILFLPGPGGLASATPSPTPRGSAAAGGSVTPSAARPSEAPISPVSSGPAETPAGPGDSTGPTDSGAASPAPSVKPTVTSLTLQHSADCTKDYGYGSGGYIKISWTSVGATGVRISIDPPDVKTAYGSGYRDEPPSGSDWVPFACDAAFHQYVVTTLHTTGYYSYRYAKVSAVTSPAPS